MSYENYVSQLEQVNNAIENCSDEQRQELLSLKRSIEELLALTSESDTAEQAEFKDVEDEYALFMAEINNSPSTALLDHRKCEQSKETDFTSLEGKKCKAPHITAWGSKGYHNAMICKIVEQKGDFNDLQVRVLFTNPTHEEMLPCPYYFETDCKFSEEKCKYSHGEIVLLSDLKEFVEPDFESLKIGSHILAKQNNNLWGRARIKRIFDSTCIVKFESIKRDIELPFDEIFPLEGDKQSTQDDNSSMSSDDEMEVQDIVNMSLLNVPSDGILGDWEKFTKRN